MKKTQEKILTNAIKLFNRKGVSNVRLQDIASEAAISPGNLSYHYKTKKDLIAAVIDFMLDRFTRMSNWSLAALGKDDHITLIRDYVSFQISHRFFNRDILEIVKLVPSAQETYEKQMHHVQNFSKNGMYLAVGKGLMKPEPYEGHFDCYAKIIWSILNSRLIEREVLGDDKVSLQDIISTIWEYNQPYLTAKGKLLFEEISKKLPELVNKEVAS
ncbi:MAG: TetR/AcrR family transcriptional regulator [Bacteroidota bacterium]